KHFFRFFGICAESPGGFPAVSYTLPGPHAPRNAASAANWGMERVSPRTFSGRPQAATASRSLGLGIPRAERPLTRVLRRWAKLARTTRKKKASSATAAGG